MSSSKITRYIFVLYIIFVSITIITEIVSVSDADNRGVSGQNYVDFMSGWIEESDGTEAELTGISGSYTIKNTLPEVKEGSVLYANLKSLNLKAYIEGKCIYDSVEYEERFFGKTAGSLFAEIPLKVEDSGKEVVFEADNPYSDGSGKITLLYLGNGLNILKNSTMSILPGFIVSVLITFLGLLFMIMFIPMWRHKTVGAEFIYFALFSFNIGFFMLTDCKFLQLIYPYAHFFHMIAEMHMMLFIIPLFLFLNKIYESCSKFMVYCVSAVSCVNFIVCYTLNILKIMDYHETVWITHLSYVVAVIFIFVIIVKELRKSGKANMYHNVGIFLIGISALLDITMLKIGTSFETTFFTRIGVLGFICLEGIQILLNVFSKYREGMKAKLVSRLAYYDGLTDLLNRTSYMEDVSKLEKKDEIDVIIALFDVNNLKHINDNYGHKSGDRMIITVAEEMKSCFGEIGKCYRIGGDEFVFISDSGCAEEKFTEAAEKFMQQLAGVAVNNRFILPITVAMGYSIAIGSGCKIESVINDADEKMYINKKQMKSAMKVAVS